MIIAVVINQRKNKKEAQTMKKAESIAGVHTHTHTRNLLENKQANDLALLSIYKTDYKYENT